MSTTITCLEKIDIRRGDKDADDARLYLVKYLHQFIDMVGILSLEVYDFAIEIEGDLISWCEGKIGGSKSQPKKFEWEEVKPQVHKIYRNNKDKENYILL